MGAPTRWTADLAAILEDRSTADLTHDLPMSRTVDEALTLHDALDLARALARRRDPQARLISVQGGEPLYPDGTCWTWFLGFALPGERAVLHCAFDADIDDEERAHPSVQERLRPVGVWTLPLPAPARLAEPLSLPALPTDHRDSPALLQAFRALGADLEDGNKYLSLAGEWKGGEARWTFTDYSNGVFTLAMETGE